MNHHAPTYRPINAAELIPHRNLCAMLSSDISLHIFFVEDSDNRAIVNIE